jgi:hypothetical protein
MSLPRPDLFIRNGKGWGDWAKQLVESLDRKDAEPKPQQELPKYTVATLPSAETEALLIYVVDEAGGPTVAFSDGTDWRRVQDRAVVS